MASADVHACSGNTIDEVALRKQIIAVHGDTSLSAQEKAKLVQKLMLQRWSSCNAKENVQPSNCSGHPVVDELNDSCKGQAKTCEGHEHEHEHDHEAEVQAGNQGCEHYKRPVQLLAKCCNKFFWCRFCHDNNSDHKINRYETEFMKCMFCYKVQPVAEKCNNDQCSRNDTPVNYFCGVCKFWDDDKAKKIYHCPHCNLCRIGKGLGIDYFHCMKCRACMPMKRKEHKCVERSLESDCPICHEYMFTSTSPVIFAKCGHCMHASCMDAYLRTNYRCPICCKSLGDMTSMFARIDHKLATEMMPLQYANTRSNIYCSDCEGKSVAPYHFLYHKCTGCGSYNTNVISTFEVAASEAAAGTSTPPAFPVMDPDEFTVNGTEDEDESDWDDEDEDEDEEMMDVDAVGETEPESDAAPLIDAATPSAVPQTRSSTQGVMNALRMRGRMGNNNSWTNDLSLEDLMALEDLENSQAEMGNGNMAAVSEEF